MSLKAEEQDRLPFTIEQLFNKARLITPISEFSLIDITKCHFIGLGLISILTLCNRLILILTLCR